ncbi:hypothetical protein RQP46_003023 [Phenoliferia psychrophenolica]
MAFTTLVTLFALSASVTAGHIAPTHLAPRATASSTASASIGRGPQWGYNNCSSSTEGADSLCQTAVINSVSDFCLWGSDGLYPNGTIGDVEAAVVAYCTRSGHGARIMPAGTITAVQFMRTPGYIQVVGLLNQTGLNLNETDSGGELDPHGADLLGGLVYSTGFSETNGTYTQTQSWNNFVGGGIFCFKLCDPSYDTTKNYCQNRFDLIGCSYNMPAAYTPDVFESCDGDLQDEVGTYTVSGSTLTWSQPSSLPATSTLPWTPRIPASSNCVTYASSDLFPISDLGYASKESLGASTTAAAAATGTSKGASGSRSGSSGSLASKTSSGSSATSTSGSSSSGGNTLGMSLGAIAAVGVAAFAAL